MRELTFKGFLTQYVRSLSKQETTSLYKLAQEAACENYRLREPLALYALYSQKQDVLLQATKDAALHAQYCDLVTSYTAEDMTQLLTEKAEVLPEEYHKVWCSYLSQKNRHDADDHTKELMRQKVKRLQEKYGVTNYRIYTYLHLNPGNLNAWLKHGQSDKVSLETARRTVRYLESKASAVRFPPGLTDDEKIDLVAADVLKRYRRAFEELAK